ncbi:pheromone-binding protein Gp-9-like isoform X2 [Hylaeus volcanicus]|uniref:pheromone-binding protein Gp-9-like isoform X2 n=1 Tax=Hylaeus volcanicus TaxID=313075 RepID=UPI0023B8733B|nr:pheromone-binding protein Gp-9-like isoform X2 [Hylaeus volcanicus]
MKLLVFVAVFVPAFLAIQATHDMGNLINGFATMFEIKTEDVETCIRQMSVTIEDFQLLGTVISDPDISEVEEGNKLYEAPGRRSMRRALCVITCCAQKQGSMIGSQIQMPVLQNMIKKMTIPREEKLFFSVAVAECNEEVRDITDECDVTFRFIRCVALKVAYFGL